MDKREGIMLAKPFQQHLFDRMPNKVIYQPKIDGDRIKAVPTSMGYKLYSSSNKLIPCLPHIEEELNNTLDFNLCPTLDGEGYVHGMPQQDIHSICSRKKNIHPDYMVMEYHLFDTIGYAKQMDRLGKLSRFSELTPRRFVKLLPSTLLGKQHFKHMLDLYISQGYEGVIVRNPSALYTYGKQSCILKHKPGGKGIYIIIEALEALSKEGIPKGMLGSLILEDNDNKQFRCGAGLLTHDERYAWWQARFKLPNMHAYIKYLSLTKDGIPREPILMRILK